MSNHKRTIRRPGRLVIERLEDRENPTGIVTATLSAGGVLSLSGDADNNDIQIELTGAGAIIAGLNGTQIRAEGALGTSADLDGSVKHIHARLNAGNDNVSINALSAFSLTGNASFDLGSGDNRLDLVTASAISIGGNLTVRAATGNDTVNLSAGLLGSGTVSGNTSILLGSGGSTVSIDDFTINGGAGLRVATGAGVDSVTLNAVAVSRGNALIFGGRDQLDVDLTGVIDVAGRLGVSGYGNVDVDVAGGTFGGFTVQGGGFGATTNVNFTGATTIDKNLSVRGSNTTVDVDAALSVGTHAYISGASATLDASGASLTVGKNLTLIAGRTATLNLATTGDANVGGNLNVVGGIDADSITANSNLTVDGNTRLALRGGNNVVTLGTTGDLDLNGSLVILTGAGNDEVSLTQVKVDTNTIIRLGAGIDNLDVQNGTTFGRTTIIDLGAGADVLAVANDLTATAGVTFTGRAIITTGLDPDTITLGVLAGGTVNTNVTFVSTGNILNTGLGLDLFTQANAQIIGALNVFGNP